MQTNHSRAPYSSHFLSGAPILRPLSPCPKHFMARYQPEAATEPSEVIHKYRLSMHQYGRGEREAFIKFPRMSVTQKSTESTQARGGCSLFGCCGRRLPAGRGGGDLPSWTGAACCKQMTLCSACFRNIVLWSFLRLYIESV